MAKFFLFLLFTINAFGSALITKDVENKTLNLTSHIFLYGEVDSILAKDIETEINQVWNQHAHQVAIEGSRYLLKFHVTTSVVTLNKAMELAQNFSSPIHNFVRIINGPNQSLTSSFMVGHTSSGVWLKTQNLGHSTTAAHEYGHSLGLDHPEGSSFDGKPRMMITDFYQVEPQFCRESTGRLDTSLREVTEVDIAELKLNTDSLGDYRTVFLFDENGDILNF